MENTQTHRRGVSEPWTEWFTVEGGFSSTRIVHYRGVRVRRVEDIANSHLANMEFTEFPVWLVWSESKLIGSSHWRFEGALKDLPSGAVHYLTYDQAHKVLLSRLGDWVAAVYLSLETAQAAINEARDLREHTCSPMPPIGKIGTFDLSGSKND